MTLRCIDINCPYQKGIDVANVDADVIIIKVTGGTHYINECWREWADTALAAGKQIGLYHYAIEKEDWPGAAAEAEYFLNQVQDYIGKFIPILDWEADAVNYPVSYAKEWLDIVAARTGATPWFYGYAKNINDTDYSEIANYPLWMASYLYRYDGAGWVDYPDQIWNTGAWDSIIAYQYTSTGDIDGYDGDLDLSIFYGSKSDWESMCGKQEEGEPVAESGLTYRAHSQNVGWGNWVTDGQTAGTTGRALRLEALQINPPEGWELIVRPHVANIGWETYTGITHGNSVIIGTTGRSLPIEDLMIEVAKRPEGDNRRLYFKVHQANYGWKGWTEEGYASGTDGMVTQLEAIQIKIQ